MPPDVPAAPASVGQSARDLVLGGRCAGCGAPGSVVCRACAATLPTCGTVHEVGGVRVGAAGPYDGVLRSLVLAHKERGVTALRPVLGDLLALAVAAGLHAAVPRDAAPVVLVPVPSRPDAVRERGHDPTLETTVHAASRLAAAGVPTRVARLLRTRTGVLDQAGLTVRQRHDNLTGSLACSGPALRRLAAATAAAHVVVCDDVVTTGSTLVEARRALAAVGLAAGESACIAVTERRVAVGVSAG